jgi:S1-C subfamily serine protease
VEPLSSDDKNSLNIDYGVRVTEINKGKFKEIGMPEGFIILSINGKKVKSTDEVQQITNNGTTLKSIEGILPDGSVLNYKFGKQ